MIYHLKNAATKSFSATINKTCQKYNGEFYMRKMIFHSIESLSLNQSQSTHAPTLCDYFSSSTSASDSDNLVLTTSKAECKRRSRKRNRNAVFTTLLGRVAKNILRFKGTRNYCFKTVGYCSRTKVKGAVSRNSAKLRNYKVTDTGGSEEKIRVLPKGVEPIALLVTSPDTLPWT